MNYREKRGKKKDNDKQKKERTIKNQRKITIGRK